MTNQPADLSLIARLRILPEGAELGLDADPVSFPEFHGVQRRRSASPIAVRS